MKKIEKGYMPPQDVDLELTVLSALMIDVKAMEIVDGILQEEIFYKPNNKEIFKAIKSLYDANNPVDLLTVSNKLKSVGKLDEVGGDYFLVNLTQKAASTAHIEYHSRILLQYYMRRRIIELCNESLRNAYDEKIDVLDSLDALGRSIDGVNETISKGYVSQTFYEAMVDVPKRVRFLTDNPDKLTGVPTGLKATDKHFNGWQPTDFIVLGADSGMGKTAFVTNNLLKPASMGIPVGMFSMEMSVAQLAIRATAVESNYHMNQLSRTGFEREEYFEGLDNVVNRVKDYPVHIDDKPALTVSEMKRKARAMVRQFGIKLLVIDFLQMFSGDGDVRIVVGDAARECKNLAKELNIPVIALSQLSREVHKNKYKIPFKHNLKEASAIEEAADVIGLLYRPAYYGYTIESDPMLFEELDLVDGENATLIVAKNRQGGLGNVGLHFIEDKTKFVDNIYNEAVVDDDDMSEFINPNDEPF